ncbi:hypothetical protein ACFVW1_01885 [Streptomyces olivochromogenes]|uniref:hypothetical protein n=1 Tax=Streptomyces olivochromogenes TaxID=1963 RepID=UPI0036DA305E
MTIVGGVVAVTVASFFLGGALMGSGDSSGSSSPDPAVEGRTGGLQQNNQQQNNEPVGLTLAQRAQMLTKYCTAQAGGPGDFSEASFYDCENNYYVTDQGMVMPK